MWDGETVPESQAVAILVGREGCAIPQGGVECEPVAGFTRSLQASAGGDVGGLVDVEEGGDLGLDSVSVDRVPDAADLLCEEEGV